MKKKNKLLVINLGFYGVCLLTGLIMLLFSDLAIKGLSSFFVIVAISSLVSLGFNKSLKLHKMVKVAMVLIGIILMIVISNAYSSNESFNEVYNTINIAYIILAIIVFPISRLCLMKTKAFMAISILMPPIIFGIILLFSQDFDFGDFLATGIWIVLGVLVLIYGGSQHQYYERPKYLTLTDGTEVEHMYDDLYKDVYGNYYTLDSSGDHLIKK